MYWQRLELDKLDGLFICYSKDVEAIPIACISDLGAFRHFNSLEQASQNKLTKVKEGSMIIPPRTNVTAEAHQSECAEMLDRVLGELVELAAVGGWNEIEIYDAMEKFVERRRSSSDLCTMARMRSN